MYCLRNAWILTGREGRFPAGYRSFDLVMGKAHKRRGGGVAYIQLRALYFIAVDLRATTIISIQLFRLMYTGVYM